MAIYPVSGPASTQPKTYQRIAHPKFNTFINLASRETVRSATAPYTIPTVSGAFEFRQGRLGTGFKGSGSGGLFLGLTENYFAESFFLAFAWRPFESATSPVVVFKDIQAAGGGGYYVQLGNVNQVIFMTGDKYSLTPADAVTLGQDHIVVINHTEGTQARIWVNGVDRTTSTGLVNNVLSSANNFRLLSFAGGTTNDAVMYWYGSGRGNLSQSEIADLTHNGPWKWFLSTNAGIQSVVPQGFVELSSPTVTDILSASARPRVTLTAA